MANENTFREIALREATKQTEIVNSLLRKSPILAGIPSDPSTHGLHNVFEEVISVTGASQMDMDGELATVSADTDLKQTDLSIIGGAMFIGEDKAKKMGGAAAYFAKKTPMIMTKTGSDMEASILYNNLRAYAIANGKGQSAGGSSAKNYSIVAVTWTPGEVAGLYDANGFGNKELMDLAPINGGNLYYETINGKKVLGYGVRMKSYFGMQLANDRYVSTIVNIDLDSTTKKPPTADQMDKLLLDCEYDMSTVIYMHPRTLLAIQAMKSTYLQMNPDQNDINRIVAYWNGVPIVTSFNFINGTEPDVVLP